VAGTPLNGFNTSYTCEMLPTPAPTPSPFTDCYYTVIAYDYEILENSPSKHGMRENGAWKYCDNEKECDRWCYLNQDDGCVGVTSEIKKDKYFPVTSINESDRGVVEGGRITFMKCATFSPSLSPTVSPTSISPTSSPVPIIAKAYIMSADEKQGFVDRHNY
jgi:hypothetical protein